MECFNQETINSINGSFYAFFNLMNLIRLMLFISNIIGILLACKD